MAEKALEALRRLGPGDWTALPAAEITRFDLLFQIGRLEEIREDLVPAYQGVLGRHPDLHCPAYEMYLVRLASATGDYARAEEAYDQLLEAQAGSEAARAVSKEIADRLGQYLLQEADRVTGMAALQPQRITGLVFLKPMPITRGSSFFLLEKVIKPIGYRYQASRANLHAMRGWNSLEGGRLTQAREHLMVAEAIATSMGCDYGMRPHAQMGLQWLNDNAN